MSRLQKAELAGNSYQGSAQSAGFNPQQAASEAADTQQLKQAIAADGATISREIQRVQSAENTLMSAQQAVARSGQQKDQASESALFRANQQIDQANLRDNQLFDKSILEQQQTHKKGQMALDVTHLRASQSASNARLQVTGQAIQGMLSFAGSAIQYGQQMQGIQKQEEAKKQQEIEQQQLNNSALGEGFFEGAKAPESTQVQGTANNAAYRADSQAIGDVATEVSQGGTAEDIFVSEQIQSEAAWNQTAGTRQGVYAARTQYPAFLAEAQMNGLIRPGAAGMEDIQRLTAKFAKASGLNLADPKLVADVFSRSALGHAQNTLTAVTNEAGREMKAARTSAINSNISTMVDGLGDTPNLNDLGNGWEQANRENVNGLYNGRTSQASTYSTTEKVLKQLALDGKGGQIALLRDYEFNPSRKGVTLGDDFDALFDKYEEEADRKSISNFNLGQAQDTMAIKQSMQTYMDDPTPENRVSAIQDLQAIGSVEALEQANRISGSGINHDPSAVFDLAIATQQGNPPSPTQVQAMMDKGIITADEAKPYLQTAEQKKSSKAITAYSGKVSASMKAAMYGDNERASVLPRVQAELAIRHQMMMGELNELVEAEVALNPGIVDDPTQLARLYESKSNYLLSQPRYQLNNELPAQFKGAITSDKSLAFISNSAGNQNFTEYTSGELFESNAFPITEMQADKDAFLTNTQLKADTKRMMEGGEASGRTAYIAKKMGMSPRAFVESQLKLNNLPSIEYMQGLEASTIAPPAAGTDLNMKSGFKALQALNVPRIGAAYLAGNIQQESTWNGMRQWGQVNNPSDGGRGDGTNRNGGLVSWASWSNDSARLGRIEAHFGGRNIAQITETEQLHYMLNVEMYNSYPEAYAVFMNPNSSAAALRKASYQYWGFGHQGSRYSHAEQLLANG